MDIRPNFKLFNIPTIILEIAILYTVLTVVDIINKCTSIHFLCEGVELDWLNNFYIVMVAQGISKFVLSLLYYMGTLIFRE